jgi:hypothetical protein
MKRVIKTVPAVVIVLFLSLIRGPAFAVTISIDDSTGFEGAPVVTIDGARCPPSVGAFSCTTTARETFGSIVVEHATITSPVFSPILPDHAVIFTEPAGGANAQNSDVLTISGGPSAQLNFFSDAVGSVNISVPGDVPSVIAENGTFQDVTSLFSNVPTGLTILVRSEAVDGAEPMPEPSTWLLLGTGLLGLFGYTWRRRKPILADIS